MKQKLRIVKVGGNVINHPEALESFLTDFSALKGLNILVHGGGKRASQMVSDLGLVPKMVDGRRITDAATLEVVTMVYAGLLNKNITASLQKKGCNALGLSGADANCIQAHKRAVTDIDYGFVGDVAAVNVQSISVFLQAGMVPVFCAMTHDQKGQLLNTNADTIAASLATGLSTAYDVELLYAFEKNGVLRDVNDDHSVIASINSASYQILKDTGVISEGMLPKMENCFEALQKGVAKVLLGNPTLLRNKEQPFTTLTL